MCWPYEEYQGHFHEDVRDIFQGAEELGYERVPYDFTPMVNEDYGRIETRGRWVVTDPTAWTTCIPRSNGLGSRRW